MAVGLGITVSHNGAIRCTLNSVMRASQRRLVALLPLLAVRARRCGVVEALLPLLLLPLAVRCASLGAATDDATAEATGYSYSRFVGPVSGPEQPVYVHDAFTGGTRLDYVARPEYQFSYGVEDVDAHVLHNRHETRDGNAVEGVYSVVDPDGSLRVVKYTADDVNGFRAEVITNGMPILHGGSQPQSHMHENDHVQGPQVAPVDVEQTPQYQVHETPQGYHQQQNYQQQQPQQQSKSNKENAGDHETNDDHEGDGQDEDDDDEEEDGEGESEPYTSYEDASHEAHSHEAYSDEVDY